MAPSKMQSKEDISVAIHRALVEVFTLQEAGLPTAIPAWTETPYDSDWSEIGFQQTENGTTVPIFPNENTKQEILLSLTKSEPLDDPGSDTSVDEVEGLGSEESWMNRGGGSTANMIEESNPTLLEENQTSVAEEISSEEELEALNIDNLKAVEDDIAQEQDTGPLTPSGLDPSWLNVSLNDMTIKFAVCLTY
jgi:hypothetical protein